MKSKYAQYVWEPNNQAWIPGDAHVLRLIDDTTTKTVVAQCDFDEAQIITAALNNARLPYRE